MEWISSDQNGSELIKFIDNLNQKHPTIKFEFTYSRTSTTFLDTKVYKNENGTLCTVGFRLNFLKIGLSHYPIFWKFYSFPFR